MESKILEKNIQISFIITAIVILLMIGIPYLNLSGFDITGAFVLDDSNASEITLPEEPEQSSIYDESVTGPAEPEPEQDLGPPITFSAQATYNERVYPIVHTNTVHSALGALSSTQVSYISSDDSTNVAITKAESVTAEMGDTANSIDTLNDANCTIVYYTVAAYETNKAEFRVYDASGGTLLEALTLTTPSTGDLTRHIVDLETKGLTASEVSTMQVYVLNQIGAKPQNFYIDAFWCDISYEYSPPVDYPQFANYYTNNTQARANEIVRFNLSVVDPTTSVSYVNGSVDGSVVAFTNAAATNWYYEKTCTDTGTVSWTTISANDTDNNWNSTAVASQSYDCDATGPAIIGPAANETTISPEELFCINITVTDLGWADVDTVYAEIWNTTDHLNITMVNDANNCTGNGADFYEATTSAEIEGEWNFSKVWANDTAGNTNSSDFEDIAVDVIWNYAIVSVTLNEPSEPVVEYRLGTFPMNCTIVTHGAPTGIDLTLRYNSTDFEWKSIETSGTVNLTATINPYTNVESNSMYNATISAYSLGEFWVRCAATNSTTTVYSSAQKVTIESDYPQFSDAYVNDTILKSGEIARFNISVYNQDTGIDYVNGTVNDAEAVFTNLAETNWYYDYTCTASDDNVEFTFIQANATCESPNSTIISGISTICDSENPSFTDYAANESTIIRTEYFCVNATVTDAGPAAIDTVYAEIWNTTDHKNVTMTNAVSACGGGGDTYTATIQATIAGQWNYSGIFANDSAGNENSLDFADINITVNPNDYLIVYNLTIQPDEGEPGFVVINPIQNDNRTVNLTVTFENGSEIDTCKIRIFNSSASYASPIFTYDGEITNCAGDYCDCFREFEMEYWRNWGDWNVSVDLNTTAGTESFNSTKFSYNQLFALNISQDTLTFSGLPGSQANSSNAYPLILKNIGNMQVDIRINGSEFVGVQNPAYVIEVSNATYCDAELGTYSPLTTVNTTIFESINATQETELYFRTYFPIGYISQIYENTIEILI